MTDPPICTQDNCNVVMRCDLREDKQWSCPVCLSPKFKKRLSSLTKDSQYEYNKNTEKFFYWRTKHREAVLKNNKGN